MTSPARKIVLIRHGESATAWRKLLSGHNGCQGLSELGASQAHRLRQRLARTGLLRDANVLITSVLNRALATTEIVRPEIGGGDLPVDSRCSLCELHWGDADGLTYEEAIEKYGFPPNMADLRERPDHAPAPGMETTTMVRDRATEGLRQVALDHPDGDVVIVTHTGVINASFFAFTGNDMSAKIVSPPPETSLTIWEQRGDEFRLERYADGSHLEELAG